MSKIKDDVYYTGYIDWDLRNFHGYSTEYGSTYNSYLINDEKPTLIDTVKHYGVEQMLDRIKKVMDPSKIQYIVSNHTEMDHSGSIDKLLAICPQAEVICSPKGAEGLKRHFKKDWNFKVVNIGEELNIGKRTLKFFLTPMVHWPDSMVTYSQYDKILFSNDAFGQHYASDNRFADEIDEKMIDYEAAKYYANIVLPYGKQVLKAIDALGGLDFDMICPSHGFIWRDSQGIEKIVASYQKWASHQTDNRGCIIYDTMWHSTEKMAVKLYEKFSAEDIPVKLLNLQKDHISNIVTEILFSKFVFFGTPILNNRMLPTMASLLMYLKGLKVSNRFAFSFGSYGWATVGFREVEAFLKEAGFQLPSEGKYLQFIPDSNELEDLLEIAEIVKNI